MCISVTPADFSGLAAVTPAAVPAPSVNSGLEPPPGLHCLLTGLKTYVDNLKLSVFERCLYVVPVVCTCVCVCALPALAVMCGDDTNEELLMRQAELESHEYEEVKARAQRKVFGM